MSAGRLRFFAPTGAKKERDEELALFRELFKREREKNANLLDSVSAELEPVDGNSAVFKISSSKKGDSVTHENEKNDYDWLKTPPATPLFQSLEMDVGHPNSLNMLVHKELPIIPVSKPSRLSEMVADSKPISTSPSSQSAASIFSPSSSRPESPDPNLTLLTMTPRLGGARNPPLRFVKESDKEVAVKPFQTRRFSSKKDEEKLRPKSPGSLSVASSASSSRPETPISTPKPPSLSLSRTSPIATSKEDSNPIERSTRRFNKEAPANQKPGFRSKIEANQRPSSPSSRSVASSSSSRPETPDSNVEPKTKKLQNLWRNPLKNPSRMHQLHPLSKNWIQNPTAEPLPQ
ncbi:hypothetical protein HPP92_011401 [Vanilla planifolia]|uniref:Uncharacterized protein n=1 Tax=Vanilla planifolia TaxID=51239 RepID=A0A835RBF6_VANPL|nr:hypothetical protein HPP92_011401 [Vanilla planifolia]